MIFINRCISICQCSFVDSVAQHVWAEAHGTEVAQTLVNEINLYFIVGKIKENEGFQLVRGNAFRIGFHCSEWPSFLFLHF